jgi:hypothetical protein
VSKEKEPPLDGASVSTLLRELLLEATFDMADKRRSAYNAVDSISRIERDCGSSTYVLTSECEAFYITYVQIGMEKLVGSLDFEAAFAVSLQQSRALAVFIDSPTVVCGVNRIEFKESISSSRDSPDAKA